MRYVFELMNLSHKFCCEISGEDPCDKASADGTSVKMLGYRWNTKKPNSKPIITLDDARDLVKEVKLTRKHVVSKLAEFYDPAGFFECYKLQLKLNLTRLNQFDWNNIIPDHEQISV